jgi:hypothetical protein
MLRRIAISISMAIGVGLVPAIFAGSAFAEGWALTVDTPLSYTFNSGNASTPASTNNNGPATWHNRTTTDVSGSKVLLIAPFHLGVGYEDYSFTEKIDFPTNPGTGTGQVKTNLRIYDVVVDIPMKHLNLTLGYGQGTADTDITSFVAGQNNPTPIRGATVSQYFLVAGIPLGKSFDFHLGYHWLTIQGKDISAPGSNGPFDQTKQDGQMLSAGLRLNF